MLLSHHRELQVLLHLLLGSSNDGILLSHEFLENTMCLLLGLQSTSEVLASSVEASEVLVATGCLQVVFAVHVLGLFQVGFVGVESCIFFINLLVHHSQVEVDAGDLRMVLTN